MTGAGRLAYLPVPVVVDQSFADRLEAAGRPESRYRFTGACVEGGCPQWTGTDCAVIDHVLDESDVTDPADGTLPSCGIRRDCRWFVQRGAAACAVCPTLVADTGGTVTYRSAHGLD
ncbi:hypothetical protein SSP24_23670 [Streptomyces spinoverrucosus]|uniref:Uncharacterized protein n=1 Tax=Streptomyces spinoverrucosus TaxID=284043 RepID=A0A4Y3VC25_9ACTN|nr:hypothetical protein [Streptomyces spinoverrucosus]GEC04712.1 hypothetical protein SSP24_23670 [Streptomyces spinoverrucosus]GHB59113.1 hypothetical protein GCM10010397_31510 [Streptomyces spinoverrucosus]